MALLAVTKELALWSARSHVVKLDDFPCQFLQDSQGNPMNSKRDCICQVVCVDAAVV